MDEAYCDDKDLVHTLYGVAVDWENETTGTGEYQNTYPAGDNVGLDTVTVLDEPPVKFRLYSL